MSYFDDNYDRIVYGPALFPADKTERKTTAPVCPYCQKRSRLTDGAEVYPHRPDLKHKRFYLCAPCDAFVGCHPDSTQALGGPANAELRSARTAAHRAFDPIWRSGKKSRSQAYSWLAGELGIDQDRCHIGMFDLETCEHVVFLCSVDDFEVLP